MRKVVLQQAATLSPTVRGLSLACVDGAPLGHEPGQWVNLHVPVAGQTQKRAYSVASAPDRAHPERFDIAVTRVEGGSVSHALHALPAGAVLQIDGPHGFFTRESTRGQPVLFVGTGTGVCPLRAMIEAELQDPHAAATHLLFGCRTEADLLYARDWERLATTGRFMLHATLSQPSPAWAGLRGYVQMHLPSLIDEAHKPHVYVCGLSRMVIEVRRVLKDELGYDRKLIHSERYD
ncbi:MAG TPA: FAD-dependent oxidoreductase [Polyangiales bacterium]